MIDPAAKMAELLAACGKPEWDRNGAAALSPIAANAALAFLDALFICPTIRGGVNVSWLGESVNIEFAADGTIETASFDFGELRDRLARGLTAEELRRRLSGEEGAT